MEPRRWVWEFGTQERCGLCSMSNMGVLLHIKGSSRGWESTSALTPCIRHVQMNVHFWGVLLKMTTLAFLDVEKEMLD